MINYFESNTYQLFIRHLLRDCIKRLSSKIRKKIKNSFLKLKVSNFSFFNSRNNVEENTEYWNVYYYCVNHFASVCAQNLSNYIGVDHAKAVMKVISILDSAFEVNFRQSLRITFNASEKTHKYIGKFTRIHTIEMIVNIYTLGNNAFH